MANFMVTVKFPPIAPVAIKRGVVAMFFMETKFTGGWMPSSSGGTPVTPSPTTVMKWG